MRKVFTSLQHPEKYGYVFDSEAWDHNAQVEDDFRMFETCGHDLIQHSADWSITRDFMADYLASLASAMLTDTELTQGAFYSLTRGPIADTIAFCAGVICKDSDRQYDKRRWYSVQERKLTASKSKEFDKRYQEVESWNDGTPEAIYRMLLPEYSHDLQRYAYAEAIRDWVNHAGKGLYMPLPRV